MTERPKGLDDLLNYVADNTDTVAVARSLRSALPEEEWKALIFKSSIIDELLDRLALYEKAVPESICPDCATDLDTPHLNGCDVARCTLCGQQRITCEHGPSDEGWGQVWTGRPLPHLDQLEHFTASPERVDEYLRDHLADDVRLRFYQWIGGYAVSEAASHLEAWAADDKADRPKWKRGVLDAAEEINPDESGGPYPSLLPIGKPWCNRPDHDHAHGGDRSPTCGIDAEN